MNKQIGILLSGIAVAILLFFVLIYDKNSIIAFLNKNKLLSQPETFTELYFEDHQELPKSLIGTDEAKFKFTVHNLEYKPYTYNYEVESISTESSKLLDSGTFTLEHDAFKTVSEIVSANEATIESKININLKNKNQSIHFWVNKHY